jgi:hypothetical protein
MKVHRRHASFGDGRCTEFFRIVSKFGLGTQMYVAVGFCWHTVRNCAPFGLHTRTPKRLDERLQ